MVNNCPSAWTLQVTVGVGQGCIKVIPQRTPSKKETRPSPYAPRLSNQHELCKCFELKGLLGNWKESDLAIRIKPEINLTPVFTININKARAIGMFMPWEAEDTERVGMN